MKFILAMWVMVAGAADVSNKNPLPQGEVAGACQIDAKTPCAADEKNKVAETESKDEKKKAKPDLLKNASPIDRAGAMFQVPGSN